MTGYHLGFHWWDAIMLMIMLTPVIIGFAWVRPDAARRGQPGWLWALLTVPLGWIALAAYLIVRYLR